MATDRIPKIGLPSDYYDRFGVLSIRSPVPNDPGFLDIVPSKTINPLAPGLRMNAPSNEASIGGRVRVADASGYRPPSTSAKSSASSLYDAIISPNGGIYKPGPQVVMSGAGSGLTSRSVKTFAVDGYGSPIITPFAAAEKALEARGDATGKLGAQARVAAALSATPSARGTLVAGKDQSRMSPNQFGYGENGVTGSEAAQVAEALAAQADRYNGYQAKFRSTPTRAGADPGDGGLFGIPMSAGMASIIATDPKYAQQRTVKFAGAAPVNRTATALAAVKAASAPAPAPAPAQPTYTTTPFQEDRFQTTTGAGMPSSMNNSRWTTGY